MLDVTYNSQKIIDSLEVTPPVTVTYGGSTIATLNAGDTKTLDILGSDNKPKILATPIVISGKTISDVDALGRKWVLEHNLEVEVGGGVMPLNNYSWAEISNIASRGEAASYWAVGDCKEITLNGNIGDGLTLTNYTAYVYILGFNHNGATNTIDFGTFKKALTGGTDVCLVDSKYGTYPTSGTYFHMNNFLSNTNGWKGCRMRYYLLGSTNRNGADAGTTTATSPVSNTLMAAMPSDLRQVMKPMTIWTDNKGGGTDTASNVTSSVDYLPLLAEFEIFGSLTYANSAERNHKKQYTYYSSGNSKVKYQHSATSSTSWWDERSPDSTDSGFFCGVRTDGTAGGISTNVSTGVAPAFRVGGGNANG